MQSSTPQKTLDAQCIKHSAFDYYTKLGRVKRYIDRNFCEDITLSNAANIACLDEKYFSNYFHKKTGIRFVDFVAYVRVERAKRLLAEHDTPICEVAISVGYNNPRSFERAFKKWTGITPRRFRRRVRPS